MIGHRATATRRGAERETGTGVAAENGGESGSETGAETGAVTNARVEGAGLGGLASGTTDIVVRYSGHSTHVAFGARLPFFASVTS
jgi:hypothetical protein